MHGLVSLQDSGGNHSSNFGNSAQVQERCPRNLFNVGFKGHVLAKDDTKALYMMKNTGRFTCWHLKFEN